MEGGVQQNDGLADGYSSCRAELFTGQPGPAPASPLSCADQLDQRRVHRGPHTCTLAGAGVGSGAAGAAQGGARVQGGAGRCGCTIGLAQGDDGAVDKLDLRRPASSEVRSKAAQRTMAQ